MLKKILIVDSDEQVTAVLELKLKKENYEVRTLSSSVNALKTLREFKPHLIISEMVLPELSGVDFLKRVKMNPETRNIPFIFLSSSKVVEDKILAHEMGAEGFFMKPVLIKVLINRIKDFFDQAKFNELLDLSKDSKDFKSDLSSISLIDVLNIIAENSSSGVVLFSSSTGEEANIYFSNGSAVRIETKGGENKNGIDELYKLLSWLDGNFVITYKDFDVQRNVRIPHDRLVVKAANWLDDYTSELNEMPPLDSKLYLDFGQFMNTINKFPDKIASIIRNFAPDGSKFSDIIEKTDLDRKLTAGYLKKLIELDVVSIRKKDTPYSLPPEPGWLKKEGESKEESGSTEDDFDAVFDNLTKKQTSKDPEESFNIEKTIVPPPSFSPRDTIDPAIGIVIDPNYKHEKVSFNVNEIALEEEVPENKEIVEKPETIELPEAVESPQVSEIDDVSEQKTEIVNSVHQDNDFDIHDDQELKSILEDHLEDVELESAARKNDPELSEQSRASMTDLSIYLILLAAAIFVAGFYYVEVKDDASSGLQDTEKIEGTPIEQHLKKAAQPLFKKPEEFSELTLNELINRSALSYEEQKYNEALEINRVALQKLKKDKIESGENYEKIITNMAIYLYMNGNFEEAAAFAEESVNLNGSEKSIELKAAILEELGKNIEAASFLRTKLKEERYSRKKEEWIIEINRLEKIKK